MRYNNLINTNNTMEKILNKLRELIKEDEQIGTPMYNYSWAKQQGILITRNDASYIVILLERLEKVANEMPGTLHIRDAICSLPSEDAIEIASIDYREDSDEYDDDDMIVVNWLDKQEAFKAGVKWFIENYINTINI